MMVNEWTAIDRGELKVPDEIRVRMRYRFSAPAPFSLNGTCAEWVQVPGGVTLRDVLCDTSQRVGATTLEYRVTHRTELTFIGAPLLVFPINAGE